MTRSRWVLAASLVLWVVSGCAFAGLGGGRMNGCTAIYSKARCLAMADQAAAEVSKTRADIAAIDIIPDPPPAGVSLGGAWPITVRVEFSDGSAHDSQMCGGLPSGPACEDDPHLSASSVMGGYHDVPCAGEPPAGCPTPFPSFEPAAKVAAVPLTIAEQTIPIDGVGRQQVKLGVATLPNGVLTDASFEFADAWPADVALADGAGRIEIRSSEPGGKPFDNYYTHGWHPGTERVEVFLVLDVLWSQPGAQLTVKNVVVR